MHEAKEAYGEVQQLISEAIRPVPGSFDAGFMSRGVPGVPREFFWRKQKYVVTQVMSTWRTTGPCRHGSGERYVRRHWFEIRTLSGEVMTLYFDKGTSGKRKEMGWFLYALGEIIRARGARLGRGKIVDLFS